MAEKVMDLNPFVRDPNTPHDPLRIKSQDADTITFKCDDPFAITEIHVDNHAAAQSQSGKVKKNPFHRETLPFHSSAGSDHKHRTNSGPPKPNMQGHYKITFTVNGREIDPDFIVD